MQVTGAEFVRLTDPPDPELTLAVFIDGTDFLQQAAPIVAAVGDVDVEGLWPRTDADGLVGFLAAEPSVGAELVIGYADHPPFATGITYSPPIA